MNVYKCSYRKLQLLFAAFPQNLLLLQFHHVTDLFVQQKLFCVTKVKCNYYCCITHTKKGCNKHFSCKQCCMIWNTWFYIPGQWDIL
jgi:hypothetical protein